MTNKERKETKRELKYAFNEAENNIKLAERLSTNLISNCDLHSAKEIEIVVANLREVRGKIIQNVDAIIKEIDESITKMK